MKTFEVLLFFLEQAAKCRWLANTVTSPDIAERLCQLASEYDALVHEEDCGAEISLSSHRPGVH